MSRTRTAEPVKVGYLPDVRRAEGFPPLTRNGEE
jgi:hypothetical protein